MSELDIQFPEGCSSCLSAATELYKLSTGEFLMELFLETTDTDGLCISLRAFHQSELERASKATAEKDKEPRPCIQCDGMSLDSIQNLVNLFVPLVSLSEALERSTSPLSKLMALAKERQEKEEEKKEAKTEQVKTEAAEVANATKTAAKVPATAGTSTKSTQVAATK